ncbi:hypothetical protein ABL57_10630, partial [Kocuria sp. SM24M-10]
MSEPRDPRVDAETQHTQPIPPVGDRPSQAPWPPAGAPAPGARPVYGAAQPGPGQPAAQPGWGSGGGDGSEGARPGRRRGFSA